MTALRTLCRAVVVLLALPALPAQALRGELAFPAEGWALVSHWHVGSTARSVREGWLRRVYNDHGWSRIKAGAALPQSDSGIWIRQVFRYKQHLWRDFVMAPLDLPPGARIYVNGEELDGLPATGDFSLGPYLRKGTNILMIAYPPLDAGTVRVPEIKLTGIGRKSGASKSLGSLRIWKFRRENVLAEIPEQWLTNSDTTPWRITVSSPPTVVDEWLPGHPYCLKAVIDVPVYWRGRKLSAFFHGFPGSPAVYLNGVKIVESLKCPVRADLGDNVRFDGKDTLVLVYDSVPPASGPGGSAWGVAALRWDSAPREPRFPSGSKLVYQGRMTADQEGVQKALLFAAEILALSATPYELFWGEMESGIAAGREYGPILPPDADGRKVAGLVAAVWSGTPFREADRSPAVDMARDLCASYLASGAGDGAERSRAWIVTPPTVGAKLGAVANTRLREHSRELVKAAGECGARTIPLNDVCRSALRGQRRWPTSPDFSDDSGRLTVHGSYLMALSILEAFSLP